MRNLYNSLFFKTKLSYVLCIVLFFLLLPANASAAILAGTEQQVTNIAADQFDPALSGNIVVYTDFSGVDADVWYTNLQTGIASSVTTQSGDQQLTGVSDNYIVYTDWNSMDVMVYDVTTGQTANITNAAGSNSLDPAISHSLVVWTDDRNGNAEIYAKDLLTGEERRISNDPLIDQSPAVKDGIIVWERADGYAADIYAYDWSTGKSIKLTSTPWASERFPDVYGRTVVYQREQGTPIDKNIVAINLDTLTEKVLTLNGDQENPHISGDFVSFNNSADGTPHIYLWQLSTGEHFQVTQGQYGQYLNDIDGNRIVYSDYRSGQLDIYMYTFSIQVTPEDDYVFGGFQQPINSDGSSIFKLGRTIPVKITISNSSGQSISTAIAKISIVRISNSVLGTEEEVILDSPGNANFGDTFRYDAVSGNYIFNLSTKGYTKGTYKIYARLDDGQSHSINLSLR